MQQRLPEAVERAREVIVGHRDRFGNTINARLEERVRALDEPEARQMRPLELKFEASAQAGTLKRHHREREQHDIEQIFDE